MIDWLSIRHFKKASKTLFLILSPRRLYEKIANKTSYGLLTTWYSLLVLRGCSHILYGLVTFNTVSSALSSLRSNIVHSVAPATGSRNTVIDLGMRGLLTETQIPLGSKYNNCIFQKFVSLYCTYIIAIELTCSHSQSSRSHAPNPTRRKTLNSNAIDDVGVQTMNLQWELHFSITLKATKDIGWVIHCLLVSLSFQ